MNVSPLAHAVLTHTVDIAPLDVGDAVEVALLTVLADQLAHEPDAPLDLPLPQDPMAIAFATRVLEDPRSTVDDHTRALGVGRRTLERRFKDETRSSLGQWHRRARLHRAVALLSTGDTVTDVAFGVGYASPSSFIAAFRAEFGVSPGAFIRQGAVPGR